MTPFGPYTLAGWRVLSDLELPELVAWPDRGNPGIPLRLDLAPHTLPPGARRFEPLPGGGFRFHAGPIADFEIAAAGDRVTAYLSEEADPLLVRAHFYGSVLAILCFQRGLFPLHGASVRIGNSAAVFSGPSGAGKSTLATVLARRGHALLSDDVSPIDLSDPSRPLAWPAFPRVKLLDDAIAAFDLSGATAYTRAPSGAKGHFGMSSPRLRATVTAPLPLGAVFSLDQEDTGSVSCTLLSGMAALKFLHSQTHRSGMGRQMGAVEQIIHQVYRIASSVPVYRLSRPLDLTRIDESAERIEQQMAAC